MTFQDFPFLGFGLGYRDFYASHFDDVAPVGVDWIEVITENYCFGDSGIETRNLRRLEELRSRLPVAMHGVSMSLGSVDPIRMDFLHKVKALVERIEPSWISDHLCWTGMNGENQHDLLPLPYTEEAVANFVEKISRVQDFLGRRILVENLSSYVEFTHSAMTEWEFITEIVQRADCGLLLDVNNIWVSSINHGFDPMEYLKGIPAHRVGQIHMAGHFVEDGYCIDTHDQPVCAGVWGLYREAARLLGPVSAMIERDDNFPPWEELTGELHHLRSIWTEENERIPAFSQRTSAPLSANP